MHDCRPGWAVYTGKGPCTTLPGFEPVCMAGKPVWLEGPARLGLSLYVWLESLSGWGLCTAYLDFSLYA
jgi:hypothetical protein